MSKYNIAEGGLCMICLSGNDGYGESRFQFQPQKDYGMSE